LRGLATNDGSHGLQHQALKRAETHHCSVGVSLASRRNHRPTLVRIVSAATLFLPVGTKTRFGVGALKKQLLFPLPPCALLAERFGLLWLRLRRIGEEGRLQNADRRTLKAETRSWSALGRDVASCPSLRRTLRRRPPALQPQAARRAFSLCAGAAVQLAPRAHAHLTSRGGSSIPRIGYGCGTRAWCGSGSRQSVGPRARALPCGSHRPR